MMRYVYGYVTDSYKKNGGKRLSEDAFEEVKPTKYKLEITERTEEETHAVWYGMLNTLGIFDVSTLTDAEKVNYTQKKHYFWLGEVRIACILEGSIAVPAGIWFAGQTKISLAFIGAAVLFLPLFVFLPKLLQRAMKADTDTVIDMFGKNEQVKKVFWTLFVAMAGLVLARVVDPVTAQQVVGIITGLGV